MVNIIAQLPVSNNIAELPGLGHGERLIEELPFKRVASGW